MNDIMDSKLLIALTVVNGDVTQSKCPSLRFCLRWKKIDFGGTDPPTIDDNLKREREE